MSGKHTRRDFLTISGMGAAALATTGALPELAASTQTQNAPGNVSVWVTDDNQQLVRSSSIAWQPATTSAAADTIVLDPERKFQEILGFGAALTDAACYTFNRLDATAREKLFHLMFHPSEMGMSVCRTCIGSSDYSTKIYSYDEGEADPELKRFSIDHDRAYILPILRRVREMNPDVFYFSSPWSPPGWMKWNKSMLGGSMSRQYLSSYAQYMLKFIEAYAAEGVPIRAITTQNEIDTDQHGQMPACTWSQECETEFITDHLGPLLERTGTATKIWILDHNYVYWGRVISELDDPAFRRYTNSVAWHG